MINFVAIVLLFLSSQIIGSQEPEGRAIEVLLDRFSRGALVYQSKKSVDTCKEIGIECSYNMPFLLLNSTLGEYVKGAYDEEDLPILPGALQERVRKKITEYKALPETVRNIRALPLSLFQKREENGTLCIIKIKAELCYKLILKSTQSEELATTDVLQRAINHFREKPNYNFSEDSPWLLGQKILEECDGKVVHGPEGYFKSEYVQQKER